MAVRGTLAVMSETPPRYRIRRKGLAWRQTGDEAVVLDIEKSEYFGLSSSATRLWQLLEVGATRDELVQALLPNAGAEADRVQADVDAFLSALQGEHLLAQD